MFTRPTPAALAACILWLISAAYVSTFVSRGWIPHDEGTIAQSAERTLRGELPHRDFDELYTGGLTYLHAAAMRVVGVSLLAPRLTLFVFFMAFVGAAYAIARRVTSGWGAVLAMALVVVWGPPSYFASLPSWYTLFFAAFGTLALLFFVEANHRRWLLVAGFAGGASMVMKITGLFYVAGGVLFLIYLEQQRWTAKAGAKSGRSRFWLVVGLPTAVCGLLLARQVWAAATPPAMIQIFLPTFGVSLFLIWQEWTSGGGTFAGRARRLGALVWPFATGVAIPLILFVAWYWRHDALADLYRGVLVLPQRRLTEAVISPPPLATLGLAVPYALLLMAGVRNGVRWERSISIALAVLLGAALFAGHNPIVYRTTWTIARSLPLVAVVALVWMLVANWGAPEATDGRPSRRRVQTFLLVTVSALLALVQVPYATPTYFFYVAPMTVLALFALVSGQKRAPVGAHLSIAGFFFVFALAFVNPSYGWNLGVAFIPYHPTSVLDLDRGGVRVSADDKQTYEELVRVLNQRAAGGTIYAGPDCPEVYFLSGFPNPTRIIFEFLSLDRPDAAWMESLLTRAPIRAVVINTDPQVSHPLEPDVLALLERRFPSFQQVGRFVVRFE